MGVSLDYVRAVIKKFESELLSIDGVVGIAPQLVDDRWVIVVYVLKDKLEEARPRIPEKLDNVPIVVKVVEEPFKILPLSLSWLGW